MPRQLIGIVRPTQYEVDWKVLKELLENGTDLKKVTFLPDAQLMTLDQLLDCSGDVQDLDEEDQDTYMKLAATIDPLSWDNIVEEPYAEGIDYFVNARLAREAIKVGRKEEILALTDDATCNVLDAALFQCAEECLQDGSPESFDNGFRQYICESPQLLCLELVKAGMKPMAMESILDQRNDSYDSFTRASYVHAAFEAGLLQELRKIQRDQQELFLTDLPLHIVLAITHDAAEDSASQSAKEYKFFGSMVEGMMTHGLSTRFSIKNILRCIEGNYEVQRRRRDACGHFSRIQESRTSFLKKWRRREIVFSQQRIALIQKFLARNCRPLMPSGVLHAIDSFLLGEFLPVLDDEVGIDFGFQ